MIQKENDLPNFPENEDEVGEEKGKDFSFSTDLEELCGDIVSVPFEVWSILNPKVSPLTEIEKKAVSKPISRLVIKYNLAEYAKDEIYLAIILSGITFKRLHQAKPEKKKNANNNNRETGNGKDNLIKENNNINEMG